ncbi:unnamed protein product [Dicrocoelium dendriticum]|nr:unnamed protein product [Dicrocoelium dendriticum]
MSKNYSANQHEHAFFPHRLQQYGPAKEIAQHPKAKAYTTTIIANDQGHLLPGQKTKPGDCPWGSYVGTWDLPCHLYGNAIDNPCARSKEAMELLQKKKERVIASINLAKGNKSRIVQERFDEALKRRTPTPENREE